MICLMIHIHPLVHDKLCNFRHRYRFEADNDFGLQVLELGICKDVINLALLCCISLLMCLVHKQGGEGISGCKRLRQCISYFRKDMSSVPLVQASNY